MKHSHTHTATMGEEDNTQPVTALISKMAATSYPRVVSLRLELGNLLLPLQKLLPANVQLFSQHSKLLWNTRAAFRGMENKLFERVKKKKKKVWF